MNDDVIWGHQKLTFNDKGGVEGVEGQLYKK